MDPADILHKILEATARRHGIQCGAVKPRLGQEKQRLGAILDQLRHAPAFMQAEDKVVIGPVVFLPMLCLVEREGKSQKLTEKERDILVLLLNAQERLVTKSDMLRDVWAYAEGVETHTLETHIYRLRQKIEEDPSKPRIILTDQDGYRLKKPI